jgi:cytochrome b6-f complex iron-sulfur subunit
MAKRLSTKEILEAARKGGAAKPADEAVPAAEAAEPEGEEPEVAVAAEASEPAETPAAPVANVPTPSSLGRPLTLKEKLAAARAGGAPAAAPAAAAPKAPAAPKAAPVAAEEAAEEAAPAAAKAVPAPAKPLGRPMTLAEKLAAARGGAGAAPAAAGPAKPAAAKAPAAAAKTAARALPPLEKMSDPRDLAEAARQAAAKKAKEIAAEAAAKAPPKPPPKAPAKPQTVPPKPGRELAGAGAAGAAPRASRRDFLTRTTTWIIAGWITFTAALSAMTLMTVRFMFPNVLAEPPSTIKIGLPSQYDPDDVSDRFKAEWGFWVVRSTRYNGQDILYALQSICTHLGCPPNWLAAEQKFKCPCHGSGFYISGINFEGPAPRPLERFKVLLADDGQIIVDKSQKFQEELKQWTDPDSFIPV